MAVASLFVRIGADIKGFSAGLANAEKKLKKFEKQNRDMAENFKGVGTAATVAGAAVGAGLGLAVNKAADFEQAMSNVKSVMAPTDVKRFGKELEQLAITMGADTKFSATEAAQGIEELVKAGVSMEAIMGGGLKGALDLAVAGELDLASAAEIASTALNAFKDDGLSITQAADVLAGAANASATSVDELRFGLSASASVASSVGMSFQDTATALAAFAQNGLKGSDAGTSLKTMLLNLQPSTKEQISLFKQLGLTAADGSNAFFDQNGQLKSLAEIAGTLQTSMAGMTDAQRLATMETLFGSDAIRAANILYKEGELGIKNMATAMGQISAAEVAATKMNNLKGRVEELKGGFDTLMISLGTALLPALNGLVSMLQGLVGWFNSLSPATQTTIAVFAAFAAGTLVLGGGLMVVLGFIPQVVAGFGMMAGAASVTTARLTLMAGFMKAQLVMAIKGVGTALTFLATNPIGIAITAIAALIAIGIAVYKNWDTVKAVLSKTWGKIKEVAVTVFNSIVDFLKKWGPLILAALAGPFGLMVYATVTHFDEIKAFIQNTLNKIISFITNLGSTFKNAGAGLINMMKDGIEKAAKKVIDKVKSIAQDIRDFLPFSPAKVGPLSDLDKLDFAGPIATAMGKGLPEIKAGMNHMLQMPSAPSMAPASGSSGGSGGPMIIIFELDKKVIGRASAEYQGGQLRIRGV